MSDEEEPAPSAPVSENEDDEAGSDAEQASRAQKHGKTGLTKCEDEYDVSQQSETLSGKDFVYGVVFVTLLAFSVKRPLNSTVQWFCCCTSDCEYVYDLTGTDGKDHLKTSIYRHLQDHVIPKDYGSGQCMC